MKRKKNRKIPKFKNREEEAEFWDTHDITDYLDEMRPVKVLYVPSLEKKQTLSLRFAPSLKKQVEKVARSYDISTSSLIRMWVVEKLRSLEMERKNGK